MNSRVQFLAVSLVCFPMSHKELNYQDHQGYKKRNKKNMTFSLTEKKKKPLQKRRRKRARGKESPQPMAGEAEDPMRTLLPARPSATRSQAFPTPPMSPRTETGATAARPAWGPRKARSPAPPGLNASSSAAARGSHGGGIMVTARC